MTDAKWAVSYQGRLGEYSAAIPSILQTELQDCRQRSPTLLAQHLQHRHLKPFYTFKHQSTPSGKFDTFRLKDSEKFIDITSRGKVRWINDGNMYMLLLDAFETASTHHTEHITPPCRGS